MSSLYANCGNKLFSFSINSNKHEKVSIADVLNQISNSCNVSIVYQDAGSKRKVKKILHDVNIHNFTFEELLDFLLNDNNLFYQMSNNGKILKISYIKTKSFYIDYVSLIQIIQIIQIIQPEVEIRLLWILHLILSFGARYKMM